MVLGIGSGSKGGSLSIINQISKTQRSLSRLIEQQSTGRRINKASDDPSGLVISEQLRAQLGSINSAISNTNRSDALIRTAESGLSQVSDQLVNLRSLAVKAAGAQTTEERNAIQAAADATVSSINRVAGTTRFGSTALLNGSQDIKTSTFSAGLSNVDVNTANFTGASTQTANVNVSAFATQAQTTETLNSAAAVSTNGATFRVSGNLGSETITVGAGATGQDVVTAINAVSASTGVSAVDTGGGAYALQSASAGSAQTATLETLQGDLTLTGQSAGQTVFSATGTDANVTVNGRQASATGNTVKFDTGTLTGSFDLNTSVAAGAQSFTVSKSGFTTQTGTGANDSTTFGIDSADASSLGISGLDLTNDPTAALAKIDAAISKVSTQRSELGSLSSNTFGPNIENLSTQFNNLTRTESSIRDLDFGSSLVESKSKGALFQVQNALLGQSNALAGGALLRLLTNL